MNPGHPRSSAKLARSHVITKMPGKGEIYTLGCYSVHHKGYCRTDRVEPLNNNSTKINKFANKLEVLLQNIRHPTVGLKFYLIWHIIFLNKQSFLSFF